MVFLFNIFYQFGDSLAFLLLAAIGLAVIFGMMKIINLAHGEFITVEHMEQLFLVRFLIYHCLLQWHLEF